jgi:hypothetical protein
MPTIVSDFIVEAVSPDGNAYVLAEVGDNYQRRFRIEVGSEIAGLRVTCIATRGAHYASIVDIRVSA